MRVDGRAPELESVQGVSNVQSRDGLVTLQIEGDIAPFLAAICGARVTDLTIEPARLEEAFLEFYAEQEEMADEQLGPNGDTGAGDGEAGAGDGATDGEAGAGGGRTDEPADRADVEVAERI